MRDFDIATARSRRRRFDDDEIAETRVTRGGRRAERDPRDDDDRPETGDAWSTWGDPGVLHGPEPTPAWVVTELAAVDHDLGVMKTGKEADVSLIEREVPGTSRGCLLAAKRYRSPEHRLFHRDAGYLEGRRVRRSRETRAMATRTAFGRQMIAGQWALAEFSALSQIWSLSQETGAVAVPYPVQLLGTELLMEYIHDSEGEAAPRLARLRPGRRELRELWLRLFEGIRVLARAGMAHGDLSPYNVLVREGQPVLIDLPQVVDIVANPQGPRLLARDVSVVTAWFVARGLPPDVADAEAVTEELLAAAGLR